MAEQIEGVTPEPQEPEIQPQGETPERIDPAEVRRLQDALKAANKEAADRRKKLEAYEKAEADRKAAEMTEAEKAAARISELEAQLEQQARAALLRKVADEVGLPASLAARLQGGSEVELLEDAKKLLELVPKKPTAPVTSPTNPGNAQRAETFAEKKQRLMGNDPNIWQGGGVHWYDPGDINHG